MFKYLYISYDAICEFASNRFFQSADYGPSTMLAKLLKRESEEWNHPRLGLLVTEKEGSFLFGNNPDKKRGVLIDYATFKGFDGRTDSEVITIFQKTVKFAMKYFDGLPFVSCEKNKSDKLALVFPFPFVAIKNVDKVYIDKNSSSQNRNDQDFLTVFFYGNSDVAKPQFTNLNKAVLEMKTVEFRLPIEQKDKVVDSLMVTDLDEEHRSYTIDERIGYDTWLKIATKKQRSFIKKDVIGAERLEGAAGSGKTISLILRCIYLLTESNSTPPEYHIIFITHSMASKERTIDIFRANCPEYSQYLEIDGNKPSRSILITTLQEWSGNHLGTNSVEETEYLDKDAETSKQFQIYYIEQALDVVMKNKWEGFSLICSNDLKKFLETSNVAVKIEMFRYEISVLIKGRADGTFEKYNNLNRPTLCLPLKNEADKAFAFEVYMEYQESLMKVGMFDSDDITLSALGQINTPIWKRRSIKDGYDVCFIDETQLFNFNELQVFHSLNKPSLSSHIVYAIDPSQTFGEVGFSEEEINSLLGKSVDTDVQLQTIFRSSTDIVNLAFNILASNSAIFSNFENPMDMCASSFTKDDDAKCSYPEYRMYNTDVEMVKGAVDSAASISKEKNIRPSNVLIVATTDELLRSLKQCFESKGKTVVSLKSKNDMHSVQSAIYNHSFVLGGIDYVGGLEFEVVIIVGVDKGRVPPEQNASPYMKYAWHNRMYVATTRAKYTILMLGNKMNGESLVLESALSTGIILPK